MSTTTPFSSKQSSSNSSSSSTPKRSPTNNVTTTIIEEEKPTEDQLLTMKNDQDVLRTIQNLAKYVPLRLTESERILLGVVEGALDHSEYTSNVDVSSSMHYVRETYDKDQRIEKEVLEFCTVLIGLNAANDFKSKGNDILGNGIKEKEEFFQKCLEIGRRFKITNPDKMRDSYGKLLYLLMDATKPSMVKHLGFKLTIPIQTVFSLIEENTTSSNSDGSNTRNILEDPALIVACGELISTSPELARKKMGAIQFLIDRYSETLGGAENVKRIISSLEDSLSFLRSNRDPVDRLIEYLMKNFNKKEPDEDDDLTLSLQGRHTKPRHQLSHDHSTQYTFVLQSLLLWREVMNDFFRLWIGAEDDLLSSRNGYNLANTGQGMQRCQQAPTTRQNMDNVLSKVQARTTGWVGLAVVHLGDREVPNALIFIDKYVQVPRIIAPIIRCLKAIEGELSQNPATLGYLKKNFGSPQRCVKLILADLFRGGFDGGGDLGGSCIDGRLTSLWNWSSLIEKKSYYPVFLLSGFLGFDGKF